MNSETVPKLSTNAPLGSFFMYDIRVKQIHSNFMTTFVDPRYEDEAISALIEEAFSETKEEKFDVESYLNGEIDYA